MTTIPKAPVSEKFTSSQGEAIDLSHHLSKLSKERKLSPLKGLQKYYNKPGIISLAGGLPNPAYFPFHSISADVLVSESFSTSTELVKKGPFSWIWALFSNRKDSTSSIAIPKYPKDPGDLNLATALQYGPANGQLQLQQVFHDFTRTVYKPAYSNFTTMIHTGNTDGWNKAFLTLCNPGEGVLTSAWTYPSAMATMLPYGSSPVPVPIDGQGMRSDSLRFILAGWDEVAQMMPRPHVMYIVPVGQNPTGATMLAQRKKEIYDICVEFDIIIVEDDPYYFLQEGPYTPPSERSGKSEDSVLDDSDDSEKYIASLAPSFLSFDYQGRVIRLDTFSKTIAPGCRLGWFTCNPIFAERLERQAETATQAPCGFAQSFVTAILLEWQPKGYLRWLKGLGAEYTRRRNFFLDCLVENFHLEPSSSFKSGSKGFDAYFASVSKEQEYIEGPIFSFIPPTSGMFVWLQFHFNSHPSVTQVEEKTLEQRLWIALAEAGVLFGPGEIFSADPSHEEVDSGHFRISFSNAEFSDLKKAVDIFTRVVKEFFKKA